MKMMLSLLDELMLLERLMKNDIQNLQKTSADSPCLIPFKNHHHHLESLLYVYIRKFKEVCDISINS
jgi:hypothetical protein